VVEGARLALADHHSKIHSGLNPQDLRSDEFSHQLVYRLKAYRGFE